MTVTVKFFAGMRERMGRAEATIPHRADLTVLGVWNAVAGGAPLEEDVLSAVNLEYVGTSHPVRDGDEVAFFPPVTGG